MNIDFNALIDTMLRAQIAKSDPQMAKLFNVFTKRGISVMDAMSMLMEISAIAEESKKGGENTQ